MLHLDRSCHSQSQGPRGVQPLLRQMLEGDQRWDRPRQITQQVQGVHQGPAPSDPHLSTEMGLVGAPIVGWPRQPRSKLRCKNLAWKHHADQAGQHPPRTLGTGTPLAPCQTTQWWQACLAGPDTAPDTGGDRFVRLPVLFRPRQNPKQRMGHQTHFTDKKTKVQGT